MAIHPDLHRRLSRLVGTWRTDGLMLERGDRDGERWGGHDIYEWFPGENQMVHRVDVTVFGGRKEGLEVFTPRAGSADTVDQISFGGDGSIDRAVGSFDAVGRYRNELDGMRATLSFDGQDAMRALWRRQVDGGRWVDWMDVRFTRVAAPHIEVRSKDDHAR